MRTFSFTILFTGLLFFSSCGGGEISKEGNTKDSALVTKDSNESLTKPEFRCVVNGKEFTYTERYCIRKPQFDHYDFSFMGGSDAFHLMLKLENEKRSVPFTIAIPKNKNEKTLGNISYERPPEIYSFPTSENRITVTEWDTVQHTITLTFEGKVTNVDRAAEFSMEGEFNKMPYEYFK